MCRNCKKKSVSINPNITLDREDANIVLNLVNHDNQIISDWAGCLQYQHWSLIPADCNILRLLPAVYLSVQIWQPGTDHVFILKSFHWVGGWGTWVGLLPHWLVWLMGWADVDCDTQHYLELRSEEYHHHHLHHHLVLTIQYSPPYVEMSTVWEYYWIIIMYDHSTPPIVALVAQQVYRIIRY